MNSQEIVFNIESREIEVLKKINNNMPLVMIKDNEKEFGVFLHPILGAFFIENEGSLKISKSFFPKPSLEEYKELGKLAKSFTNLDSHYKIYLSNKEHEKIIFEHMIKEKFYAQSDKFII